MPQSHMQAEQRLGCDPFSVTERSGIAADAAWDPKTFAVHVAAGIQVRALTVQISRGGGCTANNLTPNANGYGGTQCQWVWW